MAHSIKRFFASLACALTLLASAAAPLYAQEARGATDPRAGESESPERDAAFQKFIKELTTRQAPARGKTAAAPRPAPPRVKLQDRLTKLQGLDLPLTLKQGESFLVAFRKSFFNAQSTPPAQGRTIFYSEVKVIQVYDKGYQIQWHDVTPPEAAIKDVGDLPTLLLRMDRFGNIQYLENEEAVMAAGRKICDRLFRDKSGEDRKVLDQMLDPETLKAVWLMQPTIYFSVHGRTFWPDRVTQQPLRQQMFGAVWPALLESQVESWDEASSRLALRSSITCNVKLNAREIKTPLAKQIGPTIASAPKDDPSGIMLMQRTFRHTLNLSSGGIENGSQELIGKLNGKMVQRERMDFVTIGQDD